MPTPGTPVSQTCLHIENEICNSTCNLEFNIDQCSLLEVQMVSKTSIVKEIIFQ